MKRYIPAAVAVLLVVSAVLLGVLVPGGPIETREFSHIAPLILGTFNTFLTSLGIGSFAVAYGVLKRRRFAFGAAAFCGVSYLLVYLLDLWAIFPVSPDAMPPLLWGIEVAGSVLSLPLIALSLAGMGRAPGAADPHATPRMDRTKSVAFALLTALVAVGIIWFATDSAMR